MQKGANLTSRKNVLGRGLSALMSASAVAVDLRHKTKTVEISPSTENQSLFKGDLSRENNLKEGDLSYISIDFLTPGKLQPRLNFVQDEIDGLAESIKNTGLLQPLIIRKISSITNGSEQYEIIAGERRWRAAKQVGLGTVPVILKNISDREALELGIIENVQRANLNAIEEALAYKKLIDEFSVSQFEVAEKVGKDRTSIANALRLLKLPVTIQKLIIETKLSAGHARALLSLENEELQLKLATSIIEKGLSVRAVEQEVHDLKSRDAKVTEIHKVIRTSSILDKNMLQLEERLRRALGTKVKINLQGKGRGEIKITFFSSSELESILDKLKA